jgi:fatty-acyl-CoA synthase
MASDTHATPEIARCLADVELIESSAWQQHIPAQNTYGLIRAACERWPQRTALRLLLTGSAEAPTRDLRYDELLDGIHRTANALHACGVRPGVAVAILLPNLIEGHLALWGAEAAGIASPINALLDAGYITRICDETQAQVIIAFGPAAGSDIWDKAVAVAEQLPSVHTLIQVDATAAFGQRVAGTLRPTHGARPQRDGVRVLDFHAALADAEASALVSERHFEADEACAYFHTGGTTGYPKVAIHSHRNQAFMAWVLQKIDDRRHVMLSGLPLFHVNGALVTGLWAFHSGAEVVMLTAGGYRTPGVIEHFWAIANRFGATTFSTVPTILAALAARPLPEGGVPALQSVMCGAAPLPAQVAVNFEATTGIRIHEGYGLTEGSCVSTVNPLLGERRLGTVGLRLPFQELRLFAAGADGRPCGFAAAGAVGVIGIRGPNVFPGYLRERDNREIWIEGGWFNTGDLGRIDDAGYLILCGRAKDLIIRGGHNIDPSMIEEALARLPSVVMAAAIGQPDRHAGELPVAYVVTIAGSTINAEALLEAARQVIPERAAVPVRIELLPQLPMTAIGKVAKPQLKLLAIDHVLREAITAAGLAGVQAKARLTPDQGLVVDLTGPAASRAAAIELTGLYPVKPLWAQNEA